MHHAPAGSPLSARVAGLLARLRFRVAGILAPLGTLIAVLRRARALPLALGTFTLAAMALAGPIAPSDDEAAGTAALRSTSDGGQELVPATGDGWTQDGVPAATSPADTESRSPSKSPSKPPSGPSPAGVNATDSAPSRASTGSSTPSSSSEASGARTSSSRSTAASSSRTGSSSSSSSSRTPSSDSDVSESPSGTPSAPSETETPALDPADEVLAAVNTARTAAGCTALTPVAGLASLAAEHSAAMRDGGFVGVQSPDGGSRVDRGGRTAVVAEGSDSAAVSDAWLADATLLDCDLTRGGVGTAGGYWTLVAA